MCNQWQPNQCIKSPGGEEYFLTDIGEIENPPRQSGTAILGSGGFAHTYLATRFSTSQTEYVAIKVLKNELRQEADFQRIEYDFHNEALKLKGCQHPHVVKILDLFQYQNQWCIVMEYAGSKTLKNFVVESADKKLSPQLALKLVRQIGEALTVVHQQDLLHRDIKPSNIIIRDNTEEAVLIDFGLALRFDPNSPQINTGERTEGYAAIEQYLNQGNIGKQTDIYGLTATLYYMLKGEEPISSLKRIERIEQLTPPLVSNNITAQQESLSREEINRLNKAIFLGMKLDPNERPKNTEELLNILDQAIEDQNPPPITSQEKIWSRFKLGLAFGSILILILFGKSIFCSLSSVKLFAFVQKHCQDICIDKTNCPPEKCVSEWREYSKPELGYKIQYPNTWKKAQQGGDAIRGKFITFSSPLSANKSQSTSKITIIVHDFRTKWLSREQYYNDIISPQILIPQCNLKTLINNRDYVVETSDNKHKASWIECETKESNKRSKLMGITTVKDGKGYTIISNSNQSPTEDECIKQMLLSFEFFDGS